MFLVYLVIGALQMFSDDDDDDDDDEVVEDTPVLSPSENVDHRI